ncbi:response regulator transcription factor [candidate division KSB1 bacterium]|nr:response regulator transcription factor [candidate division KSB1 bacterium]
MRILVVEDEKKVAAFLRKGLEQEAYSVELAGNGTRALELALSEPYDLIILDLLLPGLEGMSVLRELRRQHVPVPVLILTARREVDDRVNGLDAGADDYLVKPFAFAELLARVRALLRRQGSDRSAALQMSDLTVDPVTRQVSRGARLIELTPREYAILDYLLRNTGRVMTRTLIAEHVWDYHFDSDTNLIDVYVKRLREKLEAGGEKRLLHTVRGVGYVMREHER